MLISEFVFVGWMSCSLTSFFFLWIFKEYVGCVLPILLARSVGVFIGNACWCWRLEEGEARGDGRWSIAVLRVTLRIGSRDTESETVHGQIPGLLAGVAYY